MAKFVSPTEIIDDENLQVWVPVRPTPNSFDTAPVEGIMASTPDIKSSPSNPFDNREEVSIKMGNILHSFSPFNHLGGSPEDSILDEQTKPEEDCSPEGLRSWQPDGIDQSDHLKRERMSESPSHNKRLKTAGVSTLSTYSVDTELTSSESQAGAYDRDNVKKLEGTMQAWRIIQAKTCKVVLRPHILIVNNRSAE